MESLEDRRLLAVVFADSFENGEWDGKWVEDSQLDWADSSQLATDGNYSAEVDGRATDATLTTNQPINLMPYSSAELTFDWTIESTFDLGEYLALDFSSDGTNWNEIARLSGNVDQENVWHSETIEIAPSYLTSDFKLRFRASVSASNEDANVDNVRIVDTGPPQISIGDVSVTEGDETAQFMGAVIDSTSSPIDNPKDITIGPNGNYYITSADTDAILEYNGDTFDYVRTFVSSGSGGLDGPVSLVFAQGNLFVSSGNTDAVLKYNGSTGEFLGEFVAAGAMGIDRPTDLLVHGDEL